jgi:hypothetical protein
LGRRPATLGWGHPLRRDDGQDGRFAISLRIPEWADGATLRVNGETLDLASVIDGYARIERDWKSSDHIDLDIPLARVRCLPIRWCGRTPVARFDARPDGLLR